MPFIKALPLTALNDALRATITEGRFGSARSRDGCLVLAIWGGVSFILALRWFGDVDDSRLLAEAPGWNKA